jgi:hypothetical protein
MSITPSPPSIELSRSCSTDFYTSCFFPSHINPLKFSGDTFSQMVTLTLQWKIRCINIYVTQKFLIFIQQVKITRETAN